ncbi:PEK/GCN2 protein kinase [Pseudogymnoascus sp. 03VT05]|nr:PEK/GCN2 protein kinase [Pseudogymnoascus sp. 03VT05]
MAPTYPWGGSKPKQTSKLNNTSFPSLKDNEANKPAPESEYNQIQEDELLVLGAIYGDDFEREDTKPGAWKKLEPTFNIRVTSATEDLSVVLHVVFTATYPKSAPVLTLKFPHSLREGTKFKLQKVVETKAAEMAVERPMEPMIHEIGEALKEILDGAAEAEAAGREIPSLEEERAMHETAVALKAAKEEEEQAAREREAQIAEEERLTADAQVLVARYEKNTKDSRRKSKAPVAYEDQIVDEDLEAMRTVVAFDEPIKLVDDFDNERTFQAVTSYYRIRQGPVSECFTARPVLKGDPIQLLVLKKTTIRGSENKKTEFRTQLAGLEREISTLMKIDRDNILRIYAYKLTKESGTSAASDGLWTLSILTEYGNKGSLEECLDISGSLMAERVKSWAMALLDALTYLHSQGITHRNLHASNVLLVRSPLGVVTPKIADVGFQHRLHTLKNATSPGKLELARSVYWVQPENVNSERPQYTDKTDIWDFGIIFLQMIWGLGVLREFSAPQRIPEEQVVSRPLEDMIRKLFSPDPRKRPRASDLKMSTFLTTTEGTDDEVSMPLPKSGSSVALTSLSARRGSKVDHRPLHFSRYHEDFIQEGRLGKGGFGEVLKARKKLDGQFYAVKKITQKSSSSLEEIIKEVQFLSALRHPYIVQYHNSWTEIIPDTGDADADTELDSSTAEGTTGPSPPDNGLRIEFGTSTGGLDFISSSRYIEFDDDDDADTASDDDDDNEEAIIDDEDESSSLGVPAIQHRNRRQLALSRTRSDSRPASITVLYIQMEYCEGKTLRDVIKRGSLLDNVDEIWRLLRQLLEALKYLHGNNVVHRDLKPENVFIDGASNIRLGDFGLATSGQYTIPETLSSTQGTHDMTTNIGTASYVAPEVMLGADYTSKVDLYSLGIILFEMCYHPIVGMERAEVLKELRNPKTILPSDFQADKKGHFGDIILSLLNHDPEVRPSSSSLLDSGKLPVQMGSEAIQLALASLQDPKSPYYPKMMAALYSRPTDQAKDLAWDMSNKKPPAPADSIMRTHVKEQLISVFRLHGALEVPRPIMFPRSSYYASDAVQLLEPGGTLVQLRYDLTLPFARSIAKNPPRMQKSYAFGDVFRDKSGGQPLSFGEVNFDIVSDSLDLALKEAEVIKVLDEIIASFPCMATVPMCFQLNHSDILNLIFDHCGVDVGCRLSATETLSKLHVSQWTWARIKTDLRSNGLSAASIDELSSFDFRDSPDRVFQKLKTLLDGTEAFNRASPAIAHLKDVVKYIQRFGVTSKIFITPLGSIRERFYKGGLLFSCLYDRDKKEVFAAGGRYDSLVREFLPKTGRQPEVCHAVGFNFAWENLAQSMFSYHQKSIKKQSKKPAIELHGIWKGKRCDVLVSSFDGHVLRSEGVSLMNELWRNHISAELAGDARSPEDLMSKYKDFDHFWIVTIKQDSMVKIKTMGRKDVEDVDMAESQVISWLRGQIRDRDHREGQNPNKMARRTSHNDGPGAPHLKQQVHILTTGTKAKKAALKNSIQNQAQVAAAKLVEGFLEGQVLAIETTDDILFRIKETPLSDPDKWKQLAQSVGPAERRYIQQIEDHLKGLLANRRGERRNAFLYNSRTSSIIYYDVSI